MNLCQSLIDAPPPCTAQQADMLYSTLAQQADMPP